MEFIEIRPVGAELFHADGRRGGREDMTKLIFETRLIKITALTFRRNRLSLSSEPVTNPGILFGGFNKFS